MVLSAPIKKPKIMKRYIVKMTTKETHYIEADDDVEISAETAFEHLSDETLIESEWVEIDNIDELED